MFNSWWIYKIPFCSACHAVNRFSADCDSHTFGGGICAGISPTLRRKGEDIEYRIMRSEVRQVSVGRRHVQRQSRASDVTKHSAAGCFILNS
jgi:hypothetical protein